MLHGDLALPHGVGDAELVHYILPSRSSLVLPPQILQVLLSSVHQEAEISLVLFVLVVEVVGQDIDLCGQDGDLNFRGSRVGSNSRTDHRLRCERTSQPWSQFTVCFVPSEFVDAPLDIEACLVFAAGVFQGGDGKQCL